VSITSTFTPPRYLFFSTALAVAASPSIYLAAAWRAFGRWNLSRISLLPMTLAPLEPPAAAPWCWDAGQSEAKQEEERLSKNK